MICGLGIIKFGGWMGPGAFEKMTVVGLGKGLKEQQSTCGCEYRHSHS